MSVKFNLVLKVKECLVNGLKLKDKFYIKKSAAKAINYRVPKRWVPEYQWH